MIGDDPRPLRLADISEPADITRRALELSGADLAMLALPDEEGRRLTITYAEGDGADAVRGLVLPAGQSLSGRVLATGEPVSSGDFAADERAAQAARGAMSQIGPRPREQGPYSPGPPRSPPCWSPRTRTA